MNYSTVTPGLAFTGIGIAVGSWVMTGAALLLSGVALLFLVRRSKTARP